MLVGKLELNPLKETNLGVSKALFDRYKVPLQDRHMNGANNDKDITTNAFTYYGILKISHQTDGITVGVYFFACNPITDTLIGKNNGVLSRTA